MYSPANSEAALEQRYAIGFDFGTESVRVLAVRISDGRVAAQASSRYASGVIDDVLPASGAKLPADYALQDPRDWMQSAAAACKEALKVAGVKPPNVVGIGVDFTSCTMLPAQANGTPLCLEERFARTPLAWPKLWKHHGAKSQTDRINQVAQERREPWLARYGGIIGLEWFFPKVLETLEHAPQVYQATDVWLEAGDWFVWQLISGPYPHCKETDVPRSTCQAGYKAMWNNKTGYPSREYFAAVHPEMADVVTSKMPGTLVAPGNRAGRLTARAAELLGLEAQIPVSAAIIDAHAGVPGAGVAADSTMVLVMGTSSCHMMNSKVERLAPGIAGVVEDGILPGYFGYETGQASVGDAFAWLVDTFQLSHERMAQRAAALPPGSGGVLALDWFNGCRTPLMDGRLSGSFIGLTLGTKPEQLYRALLEATAFGLRWIVQLLREAGVPVERFVASGGLPAKSPLLMQVYADVLGDQIKLAESENSVALGAAILGCLAAGVESTGHASMEAAIRAMARQRSEPVYRPRAEAQSQYDKLYALYRAAGECDGVLARTMRELRNFATTA
jgi:L-ribulokinase